ncbi:hypothetical protein ACTWPT_22825 [Nonomuraea sp. 3N208]|uniref:hypothetical protein n=1 Tax=Nonomuraea sp. 3N208 TaxID=3457421 RepID=UPI003FCDD314
MDTLLAEIVKLERVKTIGLPDGLFEGVSEKIVAGSRARAMKMYRSDFEAPGSGEAHSPGTAPHPRPSSAAGRRLRHPPCSPTATHALMAIRAFYRILGYMG